MFSITNHAFARAFVWLAILVMAETVAPGPARAAEDVIVIFNRKLADSGKVAEHYAARRQVPASHLLGLDLPTAETMTRREFKEQLQAPLLHWLIEQKLFTLASRTNQLPAAAKVRYAALCYGVPLKIARDPALDEPAALKLPEGLQRNEAAVDSELAGLPRSLTNYLLAGLLANPAYGATNPAALHPTNGLLLVARLDGPTPEIAMGLVDKALAAETNGLWGRAYFDLRSTTNADYKLGDQWLAAAAQVCWRVGYETLLETNETTFRTSFPLSHVAVYGGWYDGDVSGPFTREKVEFMPGAFAYHLHSFSAQTIRNAGSKWVGPLLAKGATATLGCVEEPYLGGTPDLGAFMTAWLGRGFTFAEAAYAAQPGLSWQTTVVGDPLYRPAGVRPQERHTELARRNSPLLEWSHVKIVMLNLGAGGAPRELASYLEKEPLTRRSAVLTELLADLYWQAKEYSDALDTTETALKRGPSPQQKVRLMLALSERFQHLGRDQRRFDLLERLLKECPDYPDSAQIRQQLAELAAKLGNSAAVEKYRPPQK